MTDEVFSEPLGALRGLRPEGLSKHARSPKYHIIPLLRACFDSSSGKSPRRAPGGSRRVKGTPGVSPEWTMRVTEESTEAGKKKGGLEKASKMRDRNAWPSALHCFFQCMSWVERATSLIANEIFHPRHFLPYAPLVRRSAHCF